MASLKKHIGSILATIIAILLGAIFNLESYNLLFVAVVIFIWSLENSRIKKADSQKEKQENIKSQ
jgi:energy-converting hydrogenase Eha subunit F